MSLRDRPLTVLLLAAAALLLAPACKRQHYTVERIPELPYPSCPPGVDMTPTVLMDRKLRSGHTDTRLPIVERYRIEKRGCLVAAVVRQEWPLQIADVEVIYDEQLLPLRIWRRQTVPGSKRPDGSPDFKRFDLRTPQITVKHKNDKGEVDLEEIRGPGKPVALIGPGRGLLSLWIRKAKLNPGEKVRELAFDFRGVEKIAPVTLQRHPDRSIDWLGGVAQVYTVLGREAVFTDREGFVLGDLAGLVLDEKAPGPAPRPMSTFEPPDPVHTP
ncbi:MAG: hypothetical protein RMJ98_16015 [Myxococcales bacterium]|nr:hypothetical protein [Polyangiaceae bacterium]MDW8250803.1 hypothetical protein [Myxococcales bacterium]